MSTSIRRNSLAGLRRANWAAANIAAGTAASTWYFAVRRRHLEDAVERERGAILIPAHHTDRQALSDAGALIEIEIGDGRRPFLLKRETALVDSRASVEPTAGNRSAARHHRLACSSSSWSSVLVIRGQSLGS